MKRILIFLLFLLFLTNINYSCAQDCPQGINLIPMYGQVKKCPQQIQSDNQFIEEAEKQFKNKKAASEYYANKRWEYFYKDELDTSMKRFNQAWLLDNKNPNAFWGFGNILGKKKEYEKSVVYLEKSIALDPNNGKVFYCAAISYGQIFVEKNDKKYLDLAIQNLNKAVKIEPKNGSYYAQLANSYAYYSKKDSLNKYIRITDEIDPKLINSEVRKFAKK